MIARCATPFPPARLPPDAVPRTRLPLPLCLPPPFLLCEELRSAHPSLAKRRHTLPAPSLLGKHLPRFPPLLPFRFVRSQECELPPTSARYGSGIAYYFFKPSTLDSHSSRALDGFCRQIGVGSLIRQSRSNAFKVFCGVVAVGYLMLNLNSSYTDVRVRLQAVA